MLTVDEKSMISRPRLFHLMDRPGATRVTLVTAPSGYGKTTMVAQWASASGRPVTWITLGPESNNPLRFREQLADAIAAGDRGELEVETIVREMATRVEAGNRPLIVFDDVHVVETTDVADAIDDLIRQLPVDVHFVLISRTVPALTLARLRADGAMREVTEADLRFTPGEARAVADLYAAGRLSDRQIATLEARTDGWIAGIRLALASLDRVGPANLDTLIDSWPVSQWLDDYIVQEVLAALPQDVREFVLRTVFLPHLVPSLCNAVLGIETSDALLDEARRRLGFVRPLDAQGGVLVYHALFAESAGRIADRIWPVSDRRERQRRAAAWYAREGRLEAAVELAVAAEDWEVAERCVRPLGQALMDRDRHHSRLYWLRKLPEARLLADPELARWYISALQYTGHLREARRALDVAGPAWRASGDPVQAGYEASCRCFNAILDGDDDRALMLAHEAVRHYPPTCAVELMHAWGAIQRIELRRGNDDAAEAAYEEARRHRAVLPVDQLWWAMHIQSGRANQQALRGNLPAALELYREALNTLPASFAEYEAMLRARQAAILLEWNDLAGALDQVAAIERSLDTVPRIVWLMDVLLVVARVYDATGNPEGLASTVARLREMHHHLGGVRVEYRIEALQVGSWLRSGKAHVAAEWAARTPVMDQSWVDIFGDNDPRLAVVMVLIGEGECETAARQLDALIARARSQKRWAELVSLGVWQAVARQQLGDVAGASASLLSAIRIGLPGGFVRSFLTPGYDLAPLVDRLRSELTGEERAWAQGVLGAATNPVGEAVGAAPAASRSAGASALTDPLSERETDVLQLLHAGCANREIAERLFITERTVKKHVGAILRKLAVGNRTAAVLRALELDLL